MKTSDAEVVAGSLFQVVKRNTRWGEEALRTWERLDASFRFSVKAWEVVAGCLQRFLLAALLVCLSLGLRNSLLTQPAEVLTDEQADCSSWLFTRSSSMKLRGSQFGEKDYSNPHMLLLAVGLASFCSFPSSILLTVGLLKGEFMLWKTMRDVLQAARSDENHCVAQT